MRFGSASAGIARPARPSALREPNPKYRRGDRGLNVLWRVPTVSGLLVVGTLGLIFWLVDPSEWDRFFHDDSFFYIKTANNLAQGLGATFDGINQTNGFHPLYMLWLAGLARLVELTGFTGLAVVVVTDTALLLLALIESFAVANNVPNTDEEKELVRKIEGGRRHTLP